MSKENEKILEVKNIYKKLSKRQILNNVSIDVYKGEIHGFLGPNGAGKTTVMKCIMGLITPEKGSIIVFGDNGLSIENKKFIGFMPENTYLYKYLTGKEFLRFNGKFFGLKGKELDEKVDYLLKKIGLEEAGNKYLKEYSKGMLQRIGLAQSIINNPKLLFLDEPMSGLDPIGKKMVKDLLLELKNNGTTIFFNTHVLSDVENICNEFSIINKGKIIVKNKMIKDLNIPLEDYFIEEVTKSN